MSDLVEILREGRARERQQAAFYRALSGEADRLDAAAEAESLNELLADEQHHVSRLTARLLELGLTLDRDPPVAVSVPELASWRDVASAREAAEVAWYEQALGRVDDAQSRIVLAEILASERHHHQSLGGKWMPAGPPSEPQEQE